MKILTIIILNTLLYYRTINFSIIVDDISWYRHIQKHPGKYENILSILQLINDRLYGAATLYNPKWKENTNIKIDHAFTTILHTTACVLIYFAFGHNNISFWAAIMYSCHPINNQTSIWLNGRRYLVNIILVLTMMIIGKWGILLYPLIGLFQVNAIFIPIVLSKHNPWFLLAIPIAIAIGYKQFKTKIDKRIKTIPDEDRTKFTPKRLIIITKYYGHYFFKMLIPGWCAFIYPMLHYWGRTKDGNKDAYSFNADWFRGIGAFIISGILICVLPVDYRIMGIFMSAAILQWCAIIPVVGDLADRYASLANVFMMFFVSYLINTYIPEYAVAILVGLTVYYSTGLLRIMRMYQDYLSYWEYHRYYSPTIPMPRNNEAKWYLDKMNPIKAWVLTQDGLAHTPNDFNLLQMAAVCHKVIGEYGSARAFAEKARQNYYLYTEKHNEPHLKIFIDSLELPSGTIVGKPSRQVVRAAERKNK